jgi:hypothetical protein
VGEETGTLDERSVLPYRRRGDRSRRQGSAPFLRQDTGKAATTYYPSKAASSECREAGAGVYTRKSRRCRHMDAWRFAAAGLVLSRSRSPAPPAGKASAALRGIKTRNAGLKLKRQMAAWESNFLMKPLR